MVKSSNKKYRTVNDLSSNPEKGSTLYIANSLTNSMYQEDNENESNKLPPLSQKEKASLINSVGNKCENPHCKNPSNNEQLTVHHIIPRSNGGSNNNKNLIIFCRVCHGKADNKIWSKELLTEWVKSRKLK